MKDLTGGVGRKMAAGSGEADLRAVILQHDTHINSLNGRIGHVEKTLEGHGMILNQHGNLLQDIKTAVTRQDARPTFDFHKSVSTVLALAVLFSMVVGGIIWVTQSQFASVVAEQKGINAAVAKVLDRHQDRIDDHGRRMQAAEVVIGRWATSFKGSGR